MKKKIAIIGAGSLSESIHIPIVQKSSVFELAYLIDRNRERLNYLSDKFAIQNTSDHMDAIIGHVDAAIVVVPNAFHYSLTKELLEQGIHVLVEKPFALSVKECEELISIANKAACCLAVGHVRRFYNNFILVKRVIQESTFGKLKSIDVEEGHYSVHSFPNDTFINKLKSGGGVTIDVGPHVFDLILWWLGDYVHVDYYDDNEGGVEAESKTVLQFQNGITVNVVLSRVRTLKNRFKLVFEKAIIEVGTMANSEFKVVFFENSSLSSSINNEIQNVREAFADQLHNFYTASFEGLDLVVDGREGQKSIQLIEQCYAQAKPLTEAYLSF